MAKLVGFVVRETEAAVAFVAEGDAATVGVKPLWLPRKKILSGGESDAMGRQIAVAGETLPRVGVPVAYDVCDEFLAKVMGR